MAMCHQNCSADLQPESYWCIEERVLYLLGTGLNQRCNVPFDGRSQQPSLLAENTTLQLFLAVHISLQ